MNNNMPLGFPKITKSFLEGQDILYTQFNKINFYIEDINQEHLYFIILKKLFPSISFDKIFPLDGKKNIIDNAAINLNDKTKIYIADLDFDGILNKIEELDNLFYLKRYSIENYLFEKKAIYELIREKKPTLKDSQIELLINLKELLKNCKILLSDLSCAFIVIMKFSLGKEYFGVSPARDFDFSCTPPIYKNNFIEDYFSEVEVLLKNIDGRYTLNSQTSSFKKYFRSHHNSLNNIPGKYILNLIKYQLEKSKLIHNINIESMTYKLSKECEVKDLNYLVDEVKEFIN